MLLQNGRIMLCIVSFVFSLFLLVYRYAEQSNTDKDQFISICRQYMMQLRLLFCQTATLQGPKLWFFMWRLWLFLQQFCYILW